MTPPAASARGDPVLDALTELVDALEENIAANRAAIERAAMIRTRRAEGADYRTIVDEAERPLVVELVTANTRRLHTHGARLRRAVAGALHDEGLTMEQIAELFGVSRQRISAILREAGD